MPSPTSENHPLSTFSTHCFSSPRHHNLPHFPLVWSITLPATATESPARKGFLRSPGDDDLAAYQIFSQTFSGIPLRMTDLRTTAYRDMIIDGAVVAIPVVKEFWATLSARPSWLWLRLRFGLAGKTRLQHFWSAILDILHLSKRFSLVLRQLDGGWSKFNEQPNANIFAVPVETMSEFFRARMQDSIPPRSLGQDKLINRLDLLTEQKPLYTIEPRLGTLRTCASLSPTFYRRLDRKWTYQTVPNNYSDRHFNDRVKIEINHYLTRSGAHERNLLWNCVVS